jgi:transmembrane sensor
MSARPSALSAFAPPDHGAARRLDPAIVAQASEHLVALWSGELDPARQGDIERWRSAHPDHELAWQRLESIRHALGSVPRETARKALLDAPSAIIGRRRALQLLGIAAMGIVAVPLARDTAAWQRFAADHRSVTGERRSIALPDGTQLLLNTGSAVDIDYGPAQRRIVLRAGEIFIATARDPAASPRPFSVHTRHGTALALGTRYAVRLDESETRVAVFEGSVRVAPQGALAQARTLAAGERARFSSIGVSMPESAGRADDAWTRGQLMVERIRLADLLTELRRYRRGLLTWDGALADLRITGVFSVDDTELALASLAQSLPLAVGRRTPYWTHLRAR